MSPPTSIRLAPVGPRALFVYYEALARGVDAAEAERLAAAEPAPRPAPARRVFDLAWRDAPYARERAREAVAAWFIRHPDAGDFFVDALHVCVWVRASRAAAFERELRALDTTGAIARLDDEGPIASAAFGARPTRAARPTFTDLAAAAA